MAVFTCRNAGPYPMGAMLTHMRTMSTSGLRSALVARVGAMATGWPCWPSIRARSISLKAWMYRTFHASAFLPVKPMARSVKPSRESR